MKIKFLSTIAATVAAALGISACSHCQAAENGGEVSKTETATTMTGKKVLVAYFSHTGENYAVGVISEGNTAVIAKMIAAETSGTLFEIKTEKTYSDVYDECTAEAKKEKESNARPALTADISAEDYDVIFIGYPNWWGDCPMAVYTFIEKHNWAGKTVVPFCTHEGSGLGGTDKNIQQACKGSTLLKGFALRGKTAQKERDEAKTAVKSWLSKIGF